ncbi:MAG: radical SAM protein [Candidatus Woesearchaeota archaeon]
MKHQLSSQENKTNSKTIKITKQSGIPLIGCIAFGILDRGTNLLQVRCTSICNANCGFCSTDGGSNSKWHKTNYLVDIDYLTEELKKITKIKGDNLIIFLDSVGEPLTHPDFIELIKKIKQIPEVKEIITITNGILLTKEKINELEKAGLTRINISLHATDPELAKELFGMPSYNINNLLEIINYIKNTKIDLMLTPVYLPGINDQEIEKIIQLCKQINCKIGLQKYETYKYSRKLKQAKKINYWKFKQKLTEWEEKYKIPLKVIKQDLNIEKRPRIPEIFKIGEKVNVKVIAPGWLPNQMIGVAKDRCISINNCKKPIGDSVNIKILQNKNNLYLAE